MSQKQQIIDYGKEAKAVFDIMNEQMTLLEKYAERHKKAFDPKVPSDYIKSQKELITLEQQNEKLQQEFIKTRQKLEELAKKQIQTAEANNRLQTKIAKDKEAQDAKTMKSHNDFYNAMQRQQKQQERLNEVNKQAERPYIQLQRRWREAQSTLADLIVKQGANAEATKKQRAEFEKLDKQIKTVDSITKNYSKNVGNYASAIGGNMSKLFGAFGLVGGITTGVAVLKDAFNTMREYEAEIVNLGAIAGKSRNELGSLEKVIRDTAKTSLNTASDVAKVATELIKLGSSTEEAEKLIPTVNNLSIALRASADETAELLKSSLNAFGEGASEAKRYGDVIAGMANKSALDFGRIRDAMSYIAPVAKQLGYTIEDTGALIGVLVDNGIKAESAGRLLRTGMVKLQAQGLTLNQALEKIKNSADPTTTALRLLGSEAGTLGVVLANNTEKLAKLSDELRNTQGELDELTNKQLQSVDAKIKMATSAWEEFVLSVENGSGVISKVVGTIIDAFADLFTQLARLNQSDVQNYAEDQLKGASKYVDYLNKETAKYINRQKELSKEKGIDYTNEMRQADELARKQLVIDGERKIATKNILDLEKQINELKSKGTLKARVEAEQLEKAQEANRAKIIGLQQVENELLEQRNKIVEKPTKTNEGTELTDKEKRAREKAEEERLKLVFERQKLELSSEIEHNRNIALINAKSDNDKQAVHIQYNADRLKLLELEYKEEQRLANGNVEKLVLARIKYQTEVQKIDDDTAKINAESLNKQYENALKLANMIEDNDLKNSQKSKLLAAKTENDKLQIRIDGINKQKAILNDREQQDIESGKYTSEELLIIYEEYNQKRVELDQEANQLITDNAKKASENIRQYLSKFTDMGNFGFSSLNLFTDIGEDGKSPFDKLLDDTKNWQEKTAVMVGAVGEVFKDLYAVINAGSQARYDAEMARLQTEFETNLMFAGDSTEARERLEEQLAEKQKELKRKKSKDDKEGAIFNAIITTAQGVASMLATVPWPLNFVMAGLVGAMGAVQVATIASTPLPEYWTGTDNAKEGWALTQERGAEVITDKHGKVKTLGHSNGATLTYMNAGDKVYKSQDDYFERELAGILNENSIGHNIVVESKGATAQEIDTIFAKHIASQVKQNTYIDERGINVYKETNNTRQKIKQKYARV